MALIFAGVIFMLDKHNTHLINDIIYITTHLRYLNIIYNLFGKHKKLFHTYSLHISERHCCSVARYLKNIG